MSAAGADAAVERWQALGTYVFLAVGDPSAIAAAREVAEHVLDRVDRACSRFRADSCLTRANSRPGRWTRVDPLLAAATRVALAAAEATDGLVDPCLGRRMVALGYDRDLGLLRQRGLHRTGPLPAPRPDAWREVEVAGDAVLVPTGCGLDLGATAKAWASDLVAECAVERLGVQVVVSLGGDIRVAGGADGWPIVVTERPDETGGEPVWLDEGGLATSSVLARRWATTDGERHHLLHPRTGLPVSGRVRTATAVGHTSVAANTAATAALVLGDRAQAWLEARQVTARLVQADGTVLTTGGWPREVAR